MIFNNNNNIIEQMLKIAYILDNNKLITHLNDFKRF
jgi:hypothetical protein